MCTLQLENGKSLLESWLVDQMKMKTLKSVFSRGQEKLKMDLSFQKRKTYGKKDIEKNFPPPYAAAQIKRLCGVIKFNVVLSYV